jgi:hypothetical protein
MTAAITWAVLATVICLIAFAICKAELRAGTKALRESGDFISHYRDRAIDAEDRLRKIEQARHLSAKHARAAQLAAKRLQVVGKAAEINREMGR